MKWQIDKSFDFCYGHRVHNQSLNAEFTGSEGVCLACRHIHGHQGKLKVHLSGDELTNGMVTDFKHLGWMKDFLDDVLDHKLILDVRDPLLPYETPEYWNDTLNELDLNKCHYNNEGYWTPDLSCLPNMDSQHPDVAKAVYEKYEGVVFVNFVPTSENLAAWLLSIARNRMQKLGVEVTAVDFWETPKSHCQVNI